MRTSPFDILLQRIRLYAHPSQEGAFSEIITIFFKYPCFKIKVSPWLGVVSMHVSWELQLIAISGNNMITILSQCPYFF